MGEGKRERRGSSKNWNGKIPGDGEEMREETVASLRRRQRKVGQPGKHEACINRYEGENENERMMAHLLIINKQIALMNSIIKGHFVNINM